MRPGQHAGAGDDIDDDSRIWGVGEMKALGQLAKSSVTMDA